MVRKKRKWFQEAVRKKPPYSLKGWSKSKSAEARRRLALASRPKNWTLKRRYRSAGQALLALANVTKDKATKLKARQDAEYFFRKLR